MHEYTGVINISGKREGVVYFTAPKAMLTVLLMKMQENDFSHETMRDLVGEVANTISGNARRDFGRDFVISVPSVVSGEKPERAAAARACAPSLSPSTGAVTQPSWSSRSPEDRAHGRVRRRPFVRIQPVTKPDLGNQKARPARVGLELVTQILDADPQAAGVVLAIRPPHLAQQLGLPHDHAGLARKALKDPILQRSEMDLPSGPRASRRARSTSTAPSFRLDVCSAPRALRRSPARTRASNSAAENGFVT